MSNKPRKKKSTAPRSTVSFAEMVSQAQLNALKPWIGKVVKAEVMQQTFAQLQRQTNLVLEHISMVQTRQMALEKILMRSMPDLTEEEIAKELCVVEDELTGYTESTEAAKEGDLVRIDYQSKAIDDEEYSAIEKIKIQSLLEERGGRVQTDKDLETAIVGLNVGDSKELLLPAEKEEEKDSKIKITVSRISVKPKKEEKTDAA